MQGGIARVTASLVAEDAPPAPFAENLANLHIVCIAVTRLNSLWHTNARLFADDNRTLFGTIRRLGFSDEQLNAEIFGKSKKWRGGQMGKTNALKYGLYTHSFTPAEITSWIGRKLTLSMINLLSYAS